MAIFIGNKSQYLIDGKFDNKYKALLLTLIFLLIASICYVLIFFFHSELVSTIVLSLLIFIMMAIFNKYIWKYLIIAKKYRAGLKGESWAYHVLKTLPDTYTVIQDVKIPEMLSNIDYVVIGPTGIFSIEVKNVKNTNIQYYVSQARNEYISLHNYLKEATGNDVFVIPILALTKRSNETLENSKYQEINILFVEDLIRFILTQKETKHIIKAEIFTYIKQNG